MLLDIKRNIVNWYPFEKNKTVLEIGVEGKTEIFSVSENSKKIFINKDSLDELYEKYDYITLIGTLDYSDEILKSENSAEILLEYAKKHLKDVGKILIACENQLGLDKLCVYSDMQYNLTKNKLDMIFEKLDLKGKKYYYTLPNYKTPNVIFTDEFLPNEENISRDFVMYLDEKILVFDQVKKFRELIRDDNKLFGKFANSFFIEVSINELKDNDIKFVSFSNIRRRKYRIKTIIKSDYVYKQALNERSKKHIENIKKNIDIMKNSNVKTIDSYDDTQIISDFQKNADTLDKIILNKFKAGEILEGIREMKNFMKFIIKNFEKSDSTHNAFDKYNIAYSEEDIQSMHFIKNGLWDMIFQNCFYINKEYYFYDQEWFEENIPVEFIMYRAILYCSSFNKYISKENLFSFLGINSKEQQLFRFLDDVFQGKIRDNDVWNVHCRQNTLEKVLNKEAEKGEAYKKQIEELKAENLILKNDIAQKNEDIRLRDEALKHKEDVINGIYNSGTWKMTEPLRKIRRIIKKKK